MMLTLTRHKARLRVAGAAFLVLTLVVTAVGHLLIFGLAPQAHLISGVAAQATLLERMDRAAVVLQSSQRGAAWTPEDMRRQREVLAETMPRFESTLRALRDGGVIVDPAGGAALMDALTDRPLLERVERAWHARRAVYAELLKGAEARQAGEAVPMDHEPTLLSMLDAVTREVEAQQLREYRRYGWALLAGLAGIGSLYAFANVASMRRLRRIDRLREAALEQAARQLEENRLLTQVAARTSNLALITDAQRRIVWVNASFERVTGWMLDEVRGRRPGELLQGPQTDAEAIAFMRRELQQGRGFTGVELVNYDRTGRPYWVEIDVQPLHGDDGRVSHFVAIESLITERRRAMAELAQAREAAEQANRAKTNFMARASHQLRTPLNGVLGLAQVLLADGRVRDATLRSHLRTIGISGKHMAALVDDMLDIARVEAGDVTVDRESVDLERLLESVCRILSSQAASHEIEVGWEVGRGARYALGDTVRVRQVALNLLSNAIKYNHRGGSVRVRCDRTGPDVVLAVMDTGIGLAPEQLDCLFEPFNRLGAERTPVPGTGIGLVIARRLAEMMQGELTVQSTPGLGCRFALRLQAAPGDPCPGTAAVSAFGALDIVRSTRCATLLYVEDNPVNALVFEACVSSGGRHTVQVASDGREALAMARSLSPDLIVLDLNLPDTDGFELSASLRCLPGMANLPHCLLSADNTPQVLRRAGELGFARVWVKPLDAVVLLRDIDALLERADAVERGEETLKPTTVHRE